MKSDTLKIFHDDLWKDKRLLAPSGGVFTKNSENREENEAEVSVLNFLRSSGITGIPAVLESDGKSIKMTCFQGIRIFELLVQLDRISAISGNELARDRKAQIIQRCEGRQRSIQNALVEWRKTQASRFPYPQSKLKSIMQVLADCANIHYAETEVNNELDKLNGMWLDLVQVPFRDATTKNMVFCCGRLPRIEIEPSKNKTESAFSIIKEKLVDDSFWRDTEIGDFDFSSCIHDTTYEDDLISLKFHERTFDGNPYIEAQDLVWNGEPNNIRAAISFYIRYYRFGGRKAAYRLINPINHRVRFFYDDDSFYFRMLNHIMRHLWVEVDNEIPALMELTQRFEKSLGTKRAMIDKFYETYPDAVREPWSGMYNRPGKK